MRALAASTALRSAEANVSGSVESERRHQASRDDQHLPGEVVRLRQVDRRVVRQADLGERLPRQETDDPEVRGLVHDDRDGPFESLPLADEGVFQLPEA